MPTGEKVKFYMYFGVQIPPPALFFANKDLNNQGVFIIL
jgi:hypothetical protein